MNSISVEQLDKTDERMGEQDDVTPKIRPSATSMIGKDGDMPGFESPDSRRSKRKENRRQNSDGEEETTSHLSGLVMHSLSANLLQNPLGHSPRLIVHAGLSGKKFSVSSKKIDGNSSSDYTATSAFGD